jgi:hypothetical protein
MRIGGRHDGQSAGGGEGKQWEKGKGKKQQRAKSRFERGAQTHEQMRILPIQQLDQIDAIHHIGLRLFALQMLQNRTSGTPAKSKFLANFTLNF